MIFLALFLIYANLLIWCDFNEGFLAGVFLFIGMFLWGCVTVAGIQMAIILFHFSCRLVKLCEDGLVIGWIKKEVYKWKDITGFGLMTFCTENYPAKAFTQKGKRRIYVVKGPFAEQSVYRGGIMGIYDLSMVKKHPVIMNPKFWVKTIPGLKNMLEFEAPDSVFWLPYSPDSYDYLKTKIASAAEISEKNHL